MALILFLWAGCLYLGTKDVHVYTQHERLTQRPSQSEIAASNKARKQGGFGMLLIVAGIVCLLTEVIPDSDPGYPLH